jgi:hypothetical protein
MANNITILDSTATTQSMRTTETDGLHFPHHIVESGLISAKIQGYNGSGGGQYIDIGVTEQGAVSVVIDTFALSESTAQIGSVTAVNHQGTTVTTSNFTSTTPSTVLASFNAGREVLTIFNEGAGNLHISAGATCTTIAYQARLSAGDYYEVPLNQTSLTHSAVFATAGTARVVQIT